MEAMQKCDLYWSRSLDQFDWSLHSDSQIALFPSKNLPNSKCISTNGSQLWMVLKDGTIAEIEREGVKKMLKFIFNLASTLSFDCSTTRTFCLICFNGIYIFVWRNVCTTSLCMLWKSLQFIVVRLSFGLCCMQKCIKTNARSLRLLLQFSRCVDIIFFTRICGHVSDICYLSSEIVSMRYVNLIQCKTDVSFFQKILPLAQIRWRQNPHCT